MIVGVLIYFFNFENVYIFYIFEILYFFVFFENL